MSKGMTPTPGRKVDTSDCALAGARGFESRRSRSPSGRLRSELLCVPLEPPLPRAAGIGEGGGSDHVAAVAALDRAAEPSL